MESKNGEFREKKRNYQALGPGLGDLRGNGCSGGTESQRAAGDQQSHVNIMTIVIKYMLCTPILLKGIGVK